MRQGLKTEKRATRASVEAATQRTRLAQALEKIRAQARTLSKARFEKLVAAALAFAHRRR